MASHLRDLGRASALDRRRDDERRQRQERPDNHAAPRDQLAEVVRVRKAHGTSFGPEFGLDAGNYTGEWQLSLARRRSPLACRHARTHTEAGAAVRSLAM